VVSMVVAPELGPGRPFDVSSRRRPHPENRKALPAPRAPGVPRELGPPSPEIDASWPATREPPADVVRGSGRLYVTVEIPGISRDTIDIQVRGSHLTIEARGPNGLLSRREVDLPEPVDSDSAQATYRNGVLDIAIPLSAAPKVRKRGGEEDV
jgi:HSP20 family molecular chaperone IbpA